MKRTSTLIMAVAVVAAASFAVVAQARSTETARADGDRNHRSADVTFTKWLTSLPNNPSAAGASMAGRVGGDVGPGAFAGMVLTDDTTSQPDFWLARALYGFVGRKHFFLADNHITENDKASPIVAAIRGEVIAGWMTGAHVTGEYTVLDPCPIPTPGNVSDPPSCFRGTLHLELPEPR